MSYGQNNPYRQNYSKSARKRYRNRKKNSGEIIFVNITGGLNIFFTIICIIEFFTGTFYILPYYLLIVPVLFAFTCMKYRNIAEYGDDVMHSNMKILTLSLFAVVVPILSTADYISIIYQEWNTNRLFFIIIFAIILYAAATLFRVFILKKRYDSIDKFIRGAAVCLIIGIICTTISSIGAGKIFSSKITEDNITVVDTYKQSTGSSTHKTMNYYVSYICDGTEYTRKVSSHDYRKIDREGTGVVLNTYKSVFGFDTVILEAEE